jgi:hypothetical protein
MFQFCSQSGGTVAGRWYHGALSIITDYHLFTKRYGGATKRPESSQSVYKKPKQIIAFRP